jgi:hypothetical protein
VHDFTIAPNHYGKSNGIDYDDLDMEQIFPQNGSRERIESFHLDYRENLLNRIVITIRIQMIQIQ